jgi:DnaJ domain
MACVCKSCVEHSRALGVGEALTSMFAIQKAYRAAAKRWHPDRFEDDEQKRLDAEERFKQIQAAYQQLCEHFENPVRRPRETEFVTPLRTEAPPTIFFGDEPGCYTGPVFPGPVQECILATRPEYSETPVGFVDMAPGRSRISQYILLTNHRMYVRDATDLLTVIWYDDLGEIKLVDRHAEKKPGAWERLAAKVTGNSQRFVLEIHRQNGTLFHALRDHPDDRVKRVIYNFLLQMKSKSQA